MLQAALSYDEDALEAQLERAVKRNLLSEDCRLPTSDFRFDTTTLRSVLYDGLSRRRRRRLHRTVVDALLKLYGDDSDRIARLLSYHYHAVEDHEATLRWTVSTDGGEVVEEGPHAALLARGGLYATMYTLQAEGYRDAPEA